MKKFLVAALFSAISTIAHAVEITVLALPAFSPTNTLPAIASAYASAVKEFEKSNPGVTVKYEYLPAYNEALRAIRARVATGNLPDVLVLDAAWLPIMQELRTIRSLDTLWTKEEQSRFFPDTVKGVTFDGKPYGVWIYNSYRGFFYRPSELAELGFKQPPQTWIEFTQLGEAAKAKGKFLTLLPGGPKVETVSHMLSVFWGLGGELVDDAGRPIVGEGKNRVALERTYALYRELIDRQFMPSIVANYDETPTRPFFYSGESLTTGQSTTLLQQMLADQPALKGNLGVFPFPLPDGAKSIPVLSGFVYSISTAQDSKVAPAWSFIKHMVDPTVLGPINAVQGHIPVQFPIWNQPFFASDPLMVQVKEAWERTGLKIIPNVPYYPEIVRIMSEQMPGVLTGRLTPAKAAENVGEQVAGAYKRATGR